MKHIAIIGGGISGLAAAYRLLELRAEHQQDFNLTVIEAAPRAGGIIQTEIRDGFLLERGPDSFITEKPETLSLARRLNLESHLIQTNEAHRRTFVVRRGRLCPVPDGFHLVAPGEMRSFLSSDIFSWAGKARMLLDLVLPRGSASRDESLAGFVRRRFGREALERMAQPMIGGIYTADPETLSLKAAMPRLLEMEQKHRSLIRAVRSLQQNGLAREAGARYSLFMSFDRGMQVLTDRLVESIAKGASVLFKTRVDAIELDGNVWRITTNNQALTADSICLAVPAFVAADLLRRTDEKLALELASMPYASSATINLAYRREDVEHPLEGFGFVVPFVEKRTLMACTFSSVKFAGRAPDGHVLLRVFVGGALQPEVMDLPDEELLAQVSRDLRDLLGTRGPALFSEISRWPKSMPQYLLGHLEKVERIRNSIANVPNLAIAGNVFTGPGLSDCIRSGQAAAEQLFSYLHKTG